ncbi:hypothetical protein [Mucilaginibacter sp. L196]|uniref:hypothetical protein n=1 Tax=Mucilaginibacter sp. L196 TaxID=1641870 RepID=UPI00131EC4AF|nr:hypothetical protein [Mucilaginibacter sp. L196]
MDIGLVNSLYEAGALSAMYRAGLVGMKVFTYREIYLWVHEQVDTRGITLSEAVIEAKEKFDKNDRTIWRALSSFTVKSLTVYA